MYSKTIHKNNIQSTNDKKIKELNSKIKSLNEKIKFTKILIKFMKNLLMSKLIINCVNYNTLCK